MKLYIVKILYLLSIDIGEDYFLKGGKISEKYIKKVYISLKYIESFLLEKVLIVIVY